MGPTTLRSPVQTRSRRGRSTGSTSSDKSAKEPKTGVHRAFVKDRETIIEPQSYQEAMNTPERDLWILAMEEEMESFMQHGVWELTKRVPGQKLLDSRWVFTLKRTLDGNVRLYKARLVARGYKQKQGIDFQEKFASVVRF